MLRFPATSCSHTCPSCLSYYLVLSPRWSVVAGQNRILCWRIQTSGTQGFKSFILFHYFFFSYLEVLTFVAVSPFSSFTFNSKVKGKYIFKTAVWVFFKCDDLCLDTRKCCWVYCRTGGGGGVHVPARL